jgi:hypothetical protein
VEKINNGKNQWKPRFLIYNKIPGKAYLAIIDLLNLDVYMFKYYVYLYINIYKNMLHIKMQRKYHKK